MIIEIIGIDGSGKTTLIHGARNHINLEGKAFAYERPFQSENVRILEAVASKQIRQRPYKVFNRDIIEIARSLELISKSSILSIYKNSPVQHVFCDSYILDQCARLLQFDICEDQNLALLDFITQPDLLIYLQLSAETAVSRMRSRLKGDSLLLERDPVSATKKAIQSIEKAMELTRLKYIVIDAERAQEEVLKDFLLVFENYKNE